MRRIFRAWFSRNWGRSRMGSYICTKLLNCAKKTMSLALVYRNSITKNSKMPSEHLHLKISNFSFLLHIYLLNEKKINRSLLELRVWRTLCEPHAQLTLNIRNQGAAAKLTQCGGRQLAITDRPLYQAWWPSCWSLWAKLVHACSSFRKKQT